MFMNAEDLVIYRDAMMLVINKPSGIAVHAGHKSQKNTLQDIFKQLTFGLPRPPELVHRLDAATSGCLILGRHRQALKKLGLLLQNHQIKKTYWAIVRGVPSENEGKIDLPLAKAENTSSSWRAKVDPNGQPALTLYKVLTSHDGLSWLELKPITGRTHQLRVHCAAMGWPIVGDTIYGAKEQRCLLHLHAYSVRIPLYPKKEPIVVVASPPEYIARFAKDFLVWQSYLP